MRHGNLAQYTAAPKRLRAAPLAAALALHFCASATAATISVNDSSAGSVVGKCTLSDAVTALNTVAAVNGCSAGNGSNDTIDLTAFATPTTITFALPSATDGNSALALTKPATIRAALDGSGQPLVTLTRSIVTGTPTFRLLATSADLTLRGLILSNGLSPDRGGAVYASAYANLVVASSTISGNTATTSGGGIATDCGNVTLTLSVVDGNNASKNGGGIYGANHLMMAGVPCSSKITFDRSDVSNNIASTNSGGGVYSFYGSIYADHASINGNHAGGRAGGGVYAFNNVTVSYSTVAGNTAVYGGGGLVGQYVTVRGTTIANNYATMTAGGIGSRRAVLIDSTLYHNGTNGYGGALNAPSVAILFSTISGNYSTATSDPIGGVRFGSYALLIGSIVEGNNGENIHGNTDVMGNHNIIGPTLPEQVLPADTVNCDPHLGALANNGGPTQTQQPAAGSCAIDAGPTAAAGYIPSDQRGPAFARKVGASTDIGAFEVQGNDRVFYDGFGL